MLILKQIIANYICSLADMFYNYTDRLYVSTRNIWIQHFVEYTLETWSIMYQALVFS